MYQWKMIPLSYNQYKIDYKFLPVLLLSIIAA